jgi:hypothetical protein
MLRWFRAKGLGRRVRPSGASALVATEKFEGPRLPIQRLSVGAPGGTFQRQHGGSAGSHRPSDTNTLRVLEPHLPEPDIEARVLTDLHLQVLLVHGRGLPDFAL